MAFAALQQQAPHQLINQDSGNFEYYTPPEIIGVARSMLGGFDLDPASCEKANGFIQAKKIFTKQDDGLSKQWHGKVWMNHPFSKGERPCPKDRSKCKKKTCRERGYHIDHPLPGNKDWIDHLIAEYRSGRVTESLNICFNSASEDWFSPLLDFPLCFIKGRVHYLGKDLLPTKSATKGSVIAYLGPNVDKFRRCFADLGVVKV